VVSQRIRTDSELLKLVKFPSSSGLFQKRLKELRNAVVSLVHH